MDKGPLGPEEDEKVGQRGRGGAERRREGGKGGKEEGEDRENQGGDPGPLGRHKVCCQDEGGSQDTLSGSLGVAPGECWSGAAQA